MYCNVHCIYIGMYIKFFNNFHTHTARPDSSAWLEETLAGRDIFGYGGSAASLP